MRQLDNLFGPHIKEFKKKFNDLPSIDISFSNVGDGENGESIYRVSISYLDNFVSDIISSEDEWEKVGKMFNELVERTTRTLRTMTERQNRMRDLEIEMPSFARNSHRVGYVDIRDFTPVMANEPVEVRQTLPMSFNEFCNELEEV